ncbi:pyrroline-5-carboxylate reductase [Lentibacillus sp. Marseille-P4043]|uniref:pyrroline-5-carboxylate reductase n=1 Tax=Lentibacillus sp. Marseille-P4043 TaxID=2040293 RepID=UPI000D0AC5FC|nr:pyrroline-5-carboxylate reductase [Lentibacillus sp. Marseille-P4043]
MVNKVCFVGAGSMAESIISGILKSGFLTNHQIFVTNKSNQERLARLQQRYDINETTDKQQAIEDADIIIFATKPYDIEEAIDQVKTHIQSGQLIISVVAGISTAYIHQKIGKTAPIIRAMPNTSASIGFSATAITAGENTGQEHLELAEILFNTIGYTTIVDEADMHAVTSISGSGPAYFYYVVEAMEKAAIEAGLDENIAKALITQTIVGAGEMLQNTGEPANILREKITSPGGTTQAAIETLDRDDFQQTIMKCVRSARDRSIELGEKED